MPQFKLIWTAAKGQWQAMLDEKHRLVAAAVQAAIETAAAEVKAGARAEIAAGGFGPRWQNTLRVEVFPKGRKPSASAAAFLFHKIPYAAIFEEGGTILPTRGRFLWIPTRNAPPSLGRNLKPTPRRWRQTIGPLVPIFRPGKAPLLATRIKASPARLQKKLSLRLFRRGTAAKRGAVQLLPVFVGIPRARIRKRFSIRAVVERARDRLGRIFERHLGDE